MALGRVAVEADGGSRGNPGPAGFGAVVLDAITDEVLAEANGAIGVATNNVAEYRGLIAGLEAARDLGAREVDVRMDSKLVVEQMNGAWKIKNDALRELARRAGELRREFDAVTFAWIPRAQNARADRLANEAMDAAGSTASATRPGISDPAAPAPAGSWGPPTDLRTRLVLVRHGATAHSADKRYSGRNALPLSEIGEAQVAGLARRRFDGVTAVVCSPLLRTRQTADAIAGALGLPVTVVDDLVETDFGAWEGMTFREVLAADAEAFAAWRGTLDVAPPGGESFVDVAARVERARAALVAEHAGGTVLVVSHVTPIKLLLGTALRDTEAALFRLHLDTASVSVVDFYGDGASSVALVNDTAHLP